MQLKHGKLENEKQSVTVN